MSEQFQRVRQGFSDRYAVERELGSGGMATVYLAEDLKHHRQVAIKVLLPSLVHTIGVQRFLREIQVIAGLQHPHVLTLIDSGEIDGLPYYVMPYVEGQSLLTRLETEGPLSIEEAVRITREIADGLHHAHERGVVHRDIKPANILMSGDHPVISDFGIATALEHATVGRITETGISLGSPLYMSPEQAAGERDLDARSDIYSLACVTYEMLAGAPPIADESMQSIVTNKLLGRLPPLREVRGDVPAQIESAVSKALAVQPQERFADAREFSSALGAAMAQEGIDLEGSAKSRRRWIAAAAAAIVVLAGLSIGFFVDRAGNRRELWAAQQLSEVELLASTGQWATAFAKAEELEDVIPNDTTLERLKPSFTDFIPIRTDPPGARVYRQMYDAPTDEWELVGTTPIDSFALPKFGSELAMRLRIEAGGYRTVELLPNVLAPWAEWRGQLPLDTVRLDKKGEIPAGMVRIPGFSIPDPVHEDGDSLHFKDYFMDKYEVTNRQYKAFMDAGGYRNPEYWTEPFIKDGREIGWEEAIQEFTDRTGRPGPSTWRLGTYPEGQGDYPVGGLSFYEAAAYARFLGKELPNSWHWWYARRFARETSWIVNPNSNLGGPGPWEVGSRRSMSAYGVYDLAGNVREWCVNPMEGGRLTRGAAWPDPEFEVGWRIPKPAFDRSETNGVRLMQHFEHDSTYAHVTKKVELSAARDYRDALPVGDAEYRIYRRLYDYEPSPLNAVVDTTGSGEHYDWEKVTFDAAYGGERAGAYIFLPKQGPPPFQSVIYWPGSGVLGDRALDHFWIEAWTGFIPRSGRALVLPLFKGALERDDEDFSVTWGSTGAHQNTSAYRDIAIQWIKDLGRTIDYLETREDFDSERIGFYGFSWGGQIAPIALAVEPRIKVAALDVGGLWVYGEDPLPEVEPLNFLPRVTTPVIMLNGEHDQVFPLETAQRPFYDLLGTPEEHKEHYVLPAAHIVPREEMISRVLDWYDRYLGVPGQ